MVDIDVKALRLSLGLTQKALARQLGVALQTVQRWEWGKAKPSPLALEKLEKFQERR